MKAGEYELLYRSESRHWWYISLRRLIVMYWRMLVTSTEPRVLDVGCGTGSLLYTLDHRAWAVGIDADPAAIRFCRRRRQRCTAVASALLLPFRDSCFDVVTSCDVLNHRNVTDKTVALREMIRVLKPGGVLMLNLPAHQWMFSSHDDAIYNDRRFTRGEILKLLRQQDVKLIKATYWNCLLFLPIALLRLWRKFHPAQNSDLAVKTNSRISRYFLSLLTWERSLIHSISFPFGLSIFILARKDEFNGHSGPSKA